MFLVFVVSEIFKISAIYNFQYREVKIECYSILVLIWKGKFGYLIRVLSTQYA
jgi:hypothetical protein